MVAPLVERGPTHRARRRSPPTLLGPTVRSVTPRPGTGADVRTGGTYRFVFSHPPAEQPMAFFGRYIEVAPPLRIVWTNEESPDGPISTVTFEERNGKTFLVLSELYPSKQALDDAIASGSTGTSGASEQFEQLDGLLVTIGRA